MELSAWFVFFVGFNALLLTLLAANVSRLRISRKIAHGDGGEIPVKAAIRVHANGVEHVPLFALVLLVLDLANINEQFFAALVVAFCLSRVMHAYGMLSTHIIFRRIGASLSYLCELAGVVAVFLSLSA